MSILSPPLLWYRPMSRILIALSFLITALFAPPSIAKSMPLQKVLATGNFSEGIAYFSAQPPTNEQRFSLATIHFLAGLERLIQDFYRIGSGANGSNRDALVREIPFLRLPVPENPQPEIATPQAFSAALMQFQTSLQQANHILGELDETEFKLPVNLAVIRMDFNGDGQYSDGEYLHVLFQGLGVNVRSGTLVHFDLGDGFWLRGYTHLLLAMSDVFLAHDGTEFFEALGHLIYPRVQTPLANTLRKYPLKSEIHGFLWDTGFIADVLTALHLSRFPLTDPERVLSAHEHLLAVIANSRLSWHWINRETDDDREWIPNANQTSVTGIALSAEQIAGWMEFLEEAEAILQGELLIGHWRFNEQVGINLKRIFTEPPSVFAPILLFQGSGILPYLEEGKSTAPSTWRNFETLFEGQFLGFALWIN